MNGLSQDQTHEPISGYKTREGVVLLIVANVLNV